MDFYSASTLKQQSADSRSTRTHYPDSEPTCPYSFSLILSAYRRSNQCYFYSLWFDQTEPTIYRTRGEYANHYATDEPTIYRTRGEYANHYATDAVLGSIDLFHGCNN
jgi:hypothetical protein